MSSAAQFVYARLQTMASGQVYPDVAPSGTLAPWVTFQQVGGGVVQYLTPDLPSKRQARVQVNCWATTRLAAEALGYQAEDLLLTDASLKATAVGAQVAVYEPDTALYGTRQDFEIWVDR